MIINLKVICTGSFFLKVDDSLTVKELYEIIAKKTKTKNFQLRRESSILHPSLDLNTYEFSQNDSVELVYEK